MKVTFLRYLDAKFHHPSLGASPPNRGKSICLPPELSLLLKRRSVNKFRHRYSMLWRLAIPALAGLLVPYQTTWQYSNGDPLTGQKSRFFRLTSGFAIDDCWSIECSQKFRPWSKVYYSRRWRRSRLISEPCLWQQCSKSFLSGDRCAEENITQFNYTHW